MNREHLRSAVQARISQINAALATLPDKNAVDAVALFQEWRVGENYAADYRLRHKDKLYRVIQPHTSQAGWEPDKTPALFTEIPKPGEIPVWKQPTGVQDAYMTGDKVHYPTADDLVWVSDVDNNVWAPGVYGWSELSSGGQ